MELGQEESRLEQMLTTTKGVRVQPPGVVCPPTVALNVDDVNVGVAIAAGGAVGSVVTILQRTCEVETVIRGVGVLFTQPAGAAAADPYSQLRVSVLLTGNPVGSQPQGSADVTAGAARSSGFLQVPIDLWNGITGLSWIFLPLKTGDVVRLVVTRVATAAGSPTTDFLCTARWKGWDYKGQADVEAGARFHAY